VQPDLPKPIVLNEEIPVPTVVLWSEKNPDVRLVAPAPEPPPMAPVLPSVLLPNKEKMLADIPIPASAMPTPTLPLVAGTTSPVVVQGPKPTPAAPLTTAQGSGQPTSGFVLSLSDQKMTNGSVMLPPVNQSASLNAPGGIRSGPSTANGASGQSASDPNGTGMGNRPSSTHISHPLEGKFGSVVVGSSLEAMYPEMAHMMNGRMVYTVYLHVGLPKSWPMQFSLTLADDAAAAGKSTHIDAPWPFSIVRPNIAPGAIRADALMVHGYVNQSGRFEGLKVVFPPQFPQVEFVLNSLAQWQFRPATQNGKNVRVEVLLIIPEILE
jgi:hypothetical protein